MKTSQKVLLIIGIIFSCLLFIVNIVLAALFPNCGANIFTAISGWVSGIATVILGIITVKQNEKFTFLNRKQNLIDSIRENQYRFIADYSEIGDVVQYADYIVEVVMLKDNDDFEKDLAHKLKQLQINESIGKFVAILPTYQYCPLYLKELREKCLNLKKFLNDNVKVANLPSSSELNKFKETALEINGNLIKIYKELNDTKNKVILEMQLLIKEIADNNDLKSLNELEDKINQNTKNMRESLVFKKDKNKEKK